jgi:hypothetical protein
VALRDQLQLYLTPILEADLELRRRKLEEDALPVIKNSLSQRGLYNSGARIRQVVAVLVDAFNAFSRHAFDELIRVHRVVGAPNEATIVEDFSGLIATVLVGAKKMFMSFSNEVKTGGGATGGTGLTVLTNDLNYAYEQALRRAKAEIGLYAAGLGAGAKPQAAGGSVQMTFHGPVGAVMTGAQATANVVQTISTDQKVLVLSALEKAEAAINTAPDLPQKVQLLEVVNECRETVEQPTPNTQKLMWLLQGLAATLSGLANGTEALEAIRAVMASFGVGG